MEIVYIETTIISYLVARPSRNRLLAAHQEITREWWERRANLYRCITSAEVLREAARGEEEMVTKRLARLAALPSVGTSTSVVLMADQLVSSGIFPREMRADAIHLAFASVAQADYLLTWNCRHLANAHIIRRLEREADVRGWLLPTICTPLELMEG